MRQGNPNQRKIVEKLRSLGHSVRVKHNQIHIEGVRASPFYPDEIVLEGQTCGLTIAGAKEFIRQNHPEPKKEISWQHKDAVTGKWIDCEEDDGEYHDWSPCGNHKCNDRGFFGHPQKHRQRKEDE